ncbi:MAG: hypothetical protein IGS23_06520 [Rivularia sp. T60_A2020_040]|nr:hypothetical protein [Rivularia sp. T60_A2020_040]
MSEFKEFSLEDEEYLLNLPYHLAQASMANDLYELITDFEFIEHKIFISSPQPLIEDYDFALTSDIQITEDKKDALKLIQGALRLSGHIVSEDNSQLAGQMLGRLSSYQMPAIQKTLKQAKQKRKSPWLHPITPSLRPPFSSLIRTLKGHTGDINAVTVTPNGHYIISAAAGLLLSSENTLKIWDFRTGAVLCTLTSHTQRVNAVVVTPDGQHIISASDDSTIKIWDFCTGQLLCTLTGHTKKVNAVVVTLDGQYIISASDDNTIRIWDFHAGNILVSLNAHTAAVTALALMPDGLQLVSGSKDKTIKVWNLTTCSEFFTLRNGITEVTTLAVTPDGKYILSGSNAIL